LRGNWRSAGWTDAMPSDGRFIMTSGNVPDSRRTVLRACYDDEALYVGIDCGEPQLKQIPPCQQGWDPAAGLHGVDLYLGPLNDELDCAQFTVNPDGGRFHHDRSATDTETTRPPWYHGWSVVARRLANRWTAVFRIPFGPHRPRPGTVWSIQVVRNRDSHFASSSWMPLSSWYHSGDWMTAEHGLLAFGPVKHKDLPNLRKDDPPIRRRSKTFSVSTTIDPPDDLLYTEWNEKVMNGFFDAVRDWGVDRVYWIDYGPAEEGWWGDSRLSLLPELAQNAHRTFRNFGGDLLPAAVDLAHRRGLELWPIFKPWDVAFTYSLLPADTPQGKRAGRAERVNGRIHTITRQMAERPELNSWRIPTDVQYDPNRTTVRTIRLVKEDAENSQVSPESLELWVSRHNHDFRRYRGPIRRRESVESRPVSVYDVRGVRALDRRQTVRVISLEGLHIRDQFIAVVPRNLDPARTGSFRNRAYALVELYDDQGRRLPFLYGAGHVNRHCGPGKLSRDWRKAGLALDCPNTGQRWPLTSHLALDSSQEYLGLALGKDDILWGVPELAEPATRAYFLDTWVDRAVEAGADGFEIRVRHHMGTQEWEAYGYHPAVREAYRQETGTDPAEGLLDYGLIQKIRGDGWIEFAREAAARLRPAGLKLSQELIWYMALNWRDRCRYNTAFEWERYLREGIVDEVSFKGVSPFTRVGGSMLRVAHDCGIPARAELHQLPMVKAPDFRNAVPDMIDELRKMGFAGLNIYETAGQMRGSPDGTFRDTTPGSQQFWTQVCHYFRRPGSKGPRPLSNSPHPIKERYPIKS